MAAVWAGHDRPSGEVEAGLTEAVFSDPLRPGLVLEDESYRRPESLISQSGPRRHVLAAERAIDLVAASRDHHNRRTRCTAGGSHQAGGRRRGEMVMSKDNVRTAFAATDNEDVRDRSNRTRSRQLSSRRHTALPEVGIETLGFDETRARPSNGRGAVHVHADGGAGRPIVRGRRAGVELFPTGTPVPGGASGVILALRGSSVTLKAPQYLYQPATPPATTPTVYEFMFWDVHTTLIATERAKFTVPSSGPVLATAWYLPVCVTTSCGPGTSAVTTWAFSLTNYKVLPDTPIGLVSPAAAWTSPSTSVSTATAMDITAQSYLGTETSSSGTVFSSWFVFGGAKTVTISGLDLNVPAGESPYPIAFYYQYTHSPIICIGFPHCI